MAKKKLGSNVANKIRQVNVNGTIYDVQDPDLEVELPKKLDKPENPTAGNAIVYDGTNWAKQDGYGYTDGSSVVHKIDTKYIPVSANPASPTTDLTGVQIGDTKYRIKGMQDGTSAGDALVWTGSTWEVQDGYGYTEAGSQTTIDWDGQAGSRETHFNGVYVKMSSEFPADFLTSFIGCKYTVSSTGSTEHTIEYYMENPEVEHFYAF